MTYKFATGSQGNNFRLSLVYYHQSLFKAYLFTRHIIKRNEFRYCYC